MFINYDREARVTGTLEAILAAVVMVILCGALYLVDLPTVWHLTAVIAVSVILLSMTLAHGFQAVCAQVHALNVSLVGLYSQP